MSDHFNKLTPAEAERLALLAEECAEVIQVVGKILRHGYESRHPDGGPTNRRLLETELGHVDASVLLMKEASDVDGKWVSAGTTEKLCRVDRYLHHSRWLVRDEEG